MKQVSDLARLLELDVDRLCFHLWGRLDGEKYASFEIPRKGGGLRTIRVPSPPLKLLQRRLNRILQELFILRPPVHGFVRGRSVVSNARRHQNQHWVLNFDLEDYFGSINFGRVRGVFMAWPWSLPNEVATAIAQLCCFQNQLPQGAPTSPVVSNMIAFRLDNALAAVARKFGCRFTRYADDITISSNDGDFPAEIAAAPKGKVTLSTAVSKLVAENGFRVNVKKTRLASAFRRQTVTGLVVNRRVNPPREFVRQIRAMIHAWQKYGLEAAEKDFNERFRREYRRPNALPVGFKKALRGKIEFLGLVRGAKDRIYLSFLRQYSALSPNERIAALEGVHDRVSRVTAALWIVEVAEGEDVRQGTATMIEGLGLVTCHHVVAGLSEVEIFKCNAPERGYRVSVLGSDEILDIAFLNASDIPEERAALRTSTTDSAHVHESSILVAGFPNYQKGDSVNLAPGSVTGKRRYGPVTRTLVSAPIMRGMSGGPALDDRERVVGILATGRDDMTHPTENQSLVPISVVKAFLQRLNVD